MQQADQAHGTTTLVRDAAGRLAQHVTGSGEATWDLLDALGSTVAGSAGNSITQLASYDDWGAQRHETSAWSAGEDYTGQPQDPTQGLLHNAARSYDPATGSWTAPDTWRGLLKAPRTLSRYQYVTNNPATYVDPDGHVCAKFAPGRDMIPLGCGGIPGATTARVAGLAQTYTLKSAFDIVRTEGGYKAPGSENLNSERHAEFNSTFLASGNWDVTGAVKCRRADLVCLTGMNVPDSRLLGKLPSVTWLGTSAAPPGQPEFAQDGLKWIPIVDGQVGPSGSVALPSRWNGPIVFRVTNSSNQIANLNYSVAIGRPSGGNVLVPPGQSFTMRVDPQSLICDSSRGGNLCANYSFTLGATPLDELEDHEKGRPGPNTGRPGQGTYPFSLEVWAGVR